MTDPRELAETIRRHYTAVCLCEWSESEWTRQTTSAKCHLHGNVPDPLDELLARVEHLQLDVQAERETVAEWHRRVEQLAAERDGYKRDFLAARERAETAEARIALEQHLRGIPPQ